jgi:hypothetical protein
LFSVDRLVASGEPVSMAGDASGCGPPSASCTAPSARASLEPPASRAPDSLVPPEPDPLADPLLDPDIWFAARDTWFAM